MKLMKIIRQSILAASAVLALCVSITAQVPSVSMRITGLAKDSANVLHFSVYLKNNSASAVSYSGSQMCIEFNKAYLNSGTGTFTLLSSALADTLRHRNLTVVTSTTPGQLRAAAPKPPRVAGGSNGAPSVAAGDSLLLGVYQLKTSAAAFASGDPSLTWRTSSAGNPYSKIGAYIGTTNTEIQSGATYYINQFTNSLALRVFIEGLFDSGSNTSAIDTMTISLRKTHHVFDLVDQVKVVNNSQGYANIEFPNAVTDTSYYLVISTRNTIETWSSVPAAFIDARTVYDFTTASSQAYGGNMVQKGSKWCIYSGDVNQDGQIEASDLLMVDSDNLNFMTGYVSTDVNNDGQVEATDLLITDTNNLNFVTAVTPGIFKSPGNAVSEYTPEGKKSNSNSK